MEFLVPVIVTLFGMIGGQFEKGVRRFGISGFAVLATLYNDIQEEGKVKKKLKYLGLLLLIPILVMGYGVNSKLMKIFKKEWLVRCMYALILAQPFWFFGWEHALVATVTLIGAFQIRAGGFKIGTRYDFLYEDLARYMTLGINLTWGIYG